MVYSFASIGAVLVMAFEDVFTQNPATLGQTARGRRQAPRDAVPPQPRGIPNRLSRRRRAARRSQGVVVAHDRSWPSTLTRTALPQANAYAPIRRRPAAAGIKSCNHRFRATGTTAYLKNGGTLEKAVAMANHASTRTTQLYDHRRDEVSRDEVERIAI